MFTKRHHEAVADAMLISRPVGYDVDYPMSERMKDLSSQWDAIVRRLANLFITDNEAFERVDFYKACGATALLREYYKIAGEQ